MNESRGSREPGAPPPQAPAEPKGNPVPAALNRQRPTVNVKLERFEGPLDLLLHLIKRDEVRSESVEPGSKNRFLVGSGVGQSLAYHFGLCDGSHGVEP